MVIGPIEMPVNSNRDLSWLNIGDECRNCMQRKPAETYDTNFTVHGRSFSGFSDTDIFPQSMIGRMEAALPARRDG
jgi:hypothetical protein